MPTDAKCGLLVGVALVLAVAVVFFQKGPVDPPPAPPLTAIPLAKSKRPEPATAALPPPAQLIQPRSVDAPGVIVSRPGNGDE